MAYFFNILFLFIGYFIGSVNFSIIIGQKKFKKDPRQFNSKNAGATNASRVYGKKIGLLIFILDMLKTVIGIMICYLLKKTVLNGQDGISTLVAGLGVIIGHCWPVFFHFKGGKGAACSAAFIAFLNPFFFILGFIMALTILKTIKKMSLASMISLLIITILTWLPWCSMWPNMSDLSWESNSNATLFWVKGIWMTLILLIIIYQHRSNIIRLIKKQESDFKI